MRMSNVVSNKNMPFSPSWTQIPVPTLKKADRKNEVRGHELTS